MLWSVVTNFARNLIPQSAPSTLLGQSTKPSFSVLPKSNEITEPRGGREIWTYRVKENATFEIEVSWRPDRKSNLMPWRLVFQPILDETQTRTLSNNGSTNTAAILVNVHDLIEKALRQPRLAESAITNGRERLLLIDPVTHNVTNPGDLRIISRFCRLVRHEGVNEESLRKVLGEGSIPSHREEVQSFGK